MTICPGKHQNFAATGCEWKRDLTADLKVLKEKFNADIIVTLLSENDLKELNVPNLIEEIKKHKMESYWYPKSSLKIRRMWWSIAWAV